MHTLYNRALPELGLRHSAYARRTLVVHVLSKESTIQHWQYSPGMRMLTLVWMHRMQQSFSYPAFFHFAMRLHGTSIVSTPPHVAQTTEGRRWVHSLRVRIPLFQKPVVQFSADGFAFVV